MVFLPGDHTLDTNITVANVTGLTMHTESSSHSKATVVRNGSVGFSFMNMVDFSVYSLVFTSFKRSNYSYYFSSYGSHPSNNFVLGLQSTQNAKLVNCSFHDNLGTALTVCNTNVILVKNEFLHNQCGCQLFSKLHKLGCGITAVNSNLTFTGTTNFFNNSANGYGGGAINAEVNTSLYFTGTSNFTRNRAEFGGGAINIAGNVVLTFNETSNFFNNSAKQNGGAIHASHSTILTFSGNNKFFNNHVLNNFGDGGAIHASHSTVLKFSGNKFFNNHVNTMGDGGAIYTSHNAVLSVESATSSTIQQVFVVVQSTQKLTHH